MNSAGSPKSGVPPRLPNMSPTESGVSFLGHVKTIYVRDLRLRTIIRGSDPLLEALVPVTCDACDYLPTSQVDIGNCRLEGSLLCVKEVDRGRLLEARAFLVSNS